MHEPLYCLSLRFLVLEDDVVEQCKLWILLVFGIFHVHFFKSWGILMGGLQFL